MLSRKNLVFQAQSNGVMDYDNNYIISVIMYNKMSLANKEYAEWLHNTGYRTHDNKKFQLFNFGLIMNDLDMLSNGIKVYKGDIIRLSISGLNEPLNNIIQGFSMNNNIMLNNINFKLINVENDRVRFHSINIYKVMSPLIESVWQDGLKFLNPYQNEYPNAIKQNLCRKYQLVYGKEYDGELELNIENFLTIKPKTIKIKNSYKQGYGKFNILLKCDKDMQKVAYYCGLGQSNSLGAGFLKYITGGE